MKKRILASLLTLSMVLSLLPTAAFAEESPVIPSPPPPSSQAVAPPQEVSFGKIVLESGCYYVAKDDIGGGQDEIVTKLTEAPEEGNYLYYTEDLNAKTANLEVFGDVTLPTRGGTSLWIDSCTLFLSGNGDLSLTSANMGGTTISNRYTDGSLKTDNYTGNLVVKNNGGERAIYVDELVLENLSSLSVSAKTDKNPVIETASTMTLHSTGDLSVVNAGSGGVFYTDTSADTFTVTSDNGNIELSTTADTLVPEDKILNLSAPNGSIFKSTAAGKTVTIGGTEYVYGSWIQQELDLSTEGLKPKVPTFYKAGTDNNRFMTYTPAVDSTPAKLALHDIYLSQRSKDTAAINHNGDLILELFGNSEIALSYYATGVKVSNGTLNITGNGNLSLFKDDSVTNFDPNYGIYAEDVIVEKDATLTISFKPSGYSRCIKCDNLTVHGTVNAYTGGSKHLSRDASPLDVTGSITVSNGGIVNTKGICFSSIRDNVVADGTFNAILKFPVGNSDGAEIAEFVTYGTPVLEGERINLYWDNQWHDQLTVSAGTTLTLAKDTTLELEPGATLTVDGTLVNNGWILLPEGTSVETIKGYHLTGDGYVLVGGTDKYSNDGTLINMIFYTLDFSDDTEDSAAYGYSWDNTNRVLTLENFNMCIDTYEFGITAITLPDNSKLVVKGKNSISGAYAYAGISCNNGLTVSGDPGSSLVIDAKASGIYCENNLAINDNTTLTISSVEFGIACYGDMAISDNVALTIKSEEWGILCENDLAISDNVALKIKSEKWGIYCENDLAISGNAATEIVSSGTGICSFAIDTAPSISINGGVTKIDADEVALLAIAKYEHTGPYPAVTDVLKIADGYLPTGTKLAMVSGDGGAGYSIVPSDGELIFDEDAGFIGSISKLTLQATVPPTPEPGGGGGDGGGAGGGGGGFSVPEINSKSPKTGLLKTDPITGNIEATIFVESTTKDGISSATVPEKDMVDALASVIKEAAKRGVSSSVVVSVNAPNDTKAVETTLSKNSLTDVANGKAQWVKISTPIADLLFDSQAVKSIIDAAAGNDIKVSAARVDTNNLTDAQKAQVGGAPVFEFTVTSGGKVISDFKGGTVTVSIPYTLKNGEDPNFITVWLLDDSGVLIPVEGSYKDGRLTFKTGHFSRYALIYLPFTDVKGHWAYSNIVYAYQNNIFSGVGNEKFAPNDSMTRAMLWSVLYRMAGSPGKTEASEIWYADAQNWAIAEKISDGSNPENNVTREQLAAILYRYAKATAVTADMSKFSDAGAISEFAKDGINWAIASGIISGDNGKLNPQNNATRAEVAAMLQRFAQKAK